VGGIVAIVKRIEIVDEDEEVDKTWMASNSFQDGASVNGGRIRDAH
jgi:hypothetical protein